MKNLGKFCKIIEMAPVDAMYLYRFTFEGARGYFEESDANFFADGFSSGTFTFIPPIKKVGAINNLKKGTFVAIKVEYIEEKK